MRHAVLLVTALASLALLPGCPVVGGCGGAGDHTMVVDGPVTMTLSAPTSDCGTVARESTYTYSFEVSDPASFVVVPDDDSVTVRDSNLDPTDFQATGDLSIADRGDDVAFDLTFNADGTLTGTALRGDATTRCNVAYTVSGTFQPEYE